MPALPPAAVGLMPELLQVLVLQPVAVRPVPLAQTLPTSRQVKLKALQARRLQLLGQQLQLLLVLVRLVPDWM